MSPTKSILIKDLMRRLPVNREEQGRLIAQANGTVTMINQSIVTD